MEFLQPLRPHEEQNVLNRLQNGDEEAKDILIQRNMRLVAYIAKKYSIPQMDTDDMISIGVVGLIKAVHSFNVEKNVKFATYASRCIQNEIFMHLRKTQNKTIDAYLNEVISRDADGNELTLLDTVIIDEPTVEQQLEKQADIQLIYRLLDNLSMKEKMIVEYRFGINRERKRQEDIAMEYEISQSYVSRIEKRAITKMRDAYQQVMG